MSATARTPRAAQVPPAAPRLHAVPSPAAHLSPRMLVERKRLLRPLAGTPSVALLVAPAGYGKTTLLRQWAKHDRRRFTWVAVDAPDHVPSRLADAIADWSRPGAGVLVVDDAHLLRARDVRETLAAAVRQAGPDHVVAIATRADPHLALGRLRTEEQLVELRAHDLAMTEAEAAMLLRRAGAAQDAEGVALLVARTEGWPAGLHLAAAALREQDNDRAALEAFAGDDHFVADYLREELLPALTDEQLELLYRTSIIDRLSGPICDAIMERDDSGEVLRELAKANVMLTAIDRAEEHFRCHRLFADMLQAELRRIAPGEVVAGHRRASAWYERAGDIEQAIDHAIAAGDGERTGRLLWSVSAGQAFGGRSAALEGWLSRFRPDEIAVRPELALAAAAGRVMSGDRDEAERWLCAAELTFDDAADGSRNSMAAAMAAVRSAIARDGLKVMAQDARRARELDVPTGPWRSFASLLGGSALLLSDHRDAGRAVLEEGARGITNGAPPLRALCLAQLAADALMRDDREGGSALAEQARSHIADAGLDTFPPCALVLAVSALARAQEGPVDAARQDAAAARAMLDRLPAVPAWYDAETRLVLACAQLRLSDAEQARELLGEAARTLRDAQDATVLLAWLDLGWERADSFAEGAVAGQVMLTTAELRVLRFLPSHLSFREIALRLHVSANTVKTQAHAVYRKLDATSRSEAVQRARTVGLVDG